MKEKVEKVRKKEKESGQEKEAGQHKMKPGDWILIGGLLLGAGLLLVLIRGVFFSDGKKAVVILDGTVIMEQDLTEDCRIPIQTLEGYNVFQVQDGTAGIAEADCRDQICVEHVEISKKGETIVCLPHKLVVEIQD
ncbi:MAG: NusG domain II-containing protein [Bacteroides sp.]|nr:NusG domain II-containing protein [Bacteroides sp.]MCM1550712.1 NusG domain II-containing protein [Clostridium sp.]